MDRSELVELLSPEGLRLLDSLPPYEPTADVVRMVSDLRKAGHAPGLVTAVLSQSRLRARAVPKFGEFAGRMLFTEAGLEQATRLRVAALHAGRFVGASLGRVVDLGCGIGGDAMAMAAMDITVTAVDTDEVTATVASFNLAPFDNAQVEQGDAETFDLSGFDAAWLDPARRTAGHTNTSRLSRPEDYSPNLDFVFGLSERMPIGVKLGPGHDRDLIPAGAEAQWVSVDGKLVEMGLWFGALARTGIRRSALLLDKEGSHELSAPADSEDVEVGALGDYVYEPDGAVIRARLIGDLAHELRTPLASLEATVEAVVDGVLPADAVTMATLHDQTTRLQHLVADMATVSRAEERQLDLHPRRVDTATLATAAAAAARARYAAAGVRIDVDVVGRAPVVRVDPDRLAEVLANLLDNALRHTPRDGAVRMVARGDPQGAVLEVSDTGEGFDPADAERIFERFYRGDSSRTRTSAGSGIGLTVARAIVEAHAGTLRATSSGRGTGATFRIRLPRVRRDLTSPPPRADGTSTR